MKIFICWSGRGSASFAAAEALKEYLPLLHDGWIPFVSEYDIKAGTLWMDELFSALDASTFGIVCISPQARKSPWLLFEAGALSKAVSSNRVLPLLIGVDESELAEPLSKFQHKEFNKSGIEAMLDSLAGASDFPDETRRLVLDRFDRLGAMKDPIKRITQRGREERKDAPAPPSDPPMIKLMKELQTQISDLAGRVQKIAIHEAPAAPVPPAVPVAPAASVIFAQPGQSFTVNDTNPSTEKGIKDG